MGDGVGVPEETRKGPWIEEEDMQLAALVALLGERRWDYIARVSGLKRTGKSCRLRWMNYLRPDLKLGRMSAQEEHTIIQLHARWGNKWSMIARRLPGRTDNEIKNYWRTHIRRKQQAREREKVQKEILEASLLAKERELSISASSFIHYASAKETVTTASENPLDLPLPLGFQVEDYSFAISPYEAQLSHCVSDVAYDSNTSSCHQECNISDSLYSFPSSISDNCDTIWGGCSGFLWDIDKEALAYNV